MQRTKSRARWIFSGLLEPNTIAKGYISCFAQFSRRSPRIESTMFVGSKTMAAMGLTMQFNAATGERDKKSKAVKNLEEVIFGSHYFLDL
uniref:Uncharacterized protein n=1 Tax=Cannabis sativa TaxID=3483 RepID=A0A803PUY3_CANSA